MINPRIVRACDRATGIREKLFCRASIVLTVAFLLTSCASNDDLKPRRKTSDRKWYQGEMDNSDRSFFIDTFFSGR